jgi:hypothetical protein
MLAKGISLSVTRARKDFTPAQRAEIYVRDRATCCFSGANLWLLDSHLRPGYETDWADHVKPSARGGSSDQSNGVCASHTFNAKKRHNTADNAYLFERGLPTWRYFSIFGPLSIEQANRLNRLANLAIPDWYFNRAVALVLLGFDYRCRSDLYQEYPRRDDKYWFRAAYRKLTEHQHSNQTPTLEERQLVIRPTEIQSYWLAIRDISSERDLVRGIEPLFEIYKANFTAWARYFFDAETDKERLHALRYAERKAGLTGDTLQCIHDDYALRTQTQMGDRCLGLLRV